MRQTLLQLATRVAQLEAPTLDVAELTTMVCAVQMNTFERFTPGERWAVLARALMAPHPGHFFEALRSCGGLVRLLPELDALFGVPLLGDDPEPHEVGWHQLRLINEAARIGAPLAVRLAGLAHKLGMAGTPAEILPRHYKHEQRGHAALDALAMRIAVPTEVLDLAHLVIAECDRVHRASDMRAGPIAEMLSRLQALEQPARFEQLLSVCACDYAAYPGHSATPYPKADRLRRALVAYASTDVSGLSADAAMQARAQAIAHTLRGSTSLQ